MIIIALDRYTSGTCIIHPLDNGSYPLITLIEDKQDTSCTMLYLHIDIETVIVVTSDPAARAGITTARTISVGATKGWIRKIDRQAFAFSRWKSTSRSIIVGRSTTIGFKVHYLLTNSSPTVY